MKIQPRCDHHDGKKCCPDAGGYFPVVMHQGQLRPSVALYCKRHRGIPGAVRYLTIAQAKKIRVGGLGTLDQALGTLEQAV